MADEIGENLCFRYKNGNIQQCRYAYDYYKLHNPGSFNDWGYDQKTIIFLDTNVLLQTYFLSQVEKKSIIKFITTNKERIIIASQVDEEYQKHRLDFISGYNKQLDRLVKDTNSIVSFIIKSLNGEALEKIKELTENHVLKYDFIGEFIDLCNILIEINAYYDCLKEER